MVTITCPKCRTELEVPDHLGGKKVRCPECGERLGTTVLPAEEAPRAARGPSRKDALTREPGRKAPSTPEGRPARRRPDDEDDPPTARRKTSRPSRAAAPRSSSAGLVIGLVVGGAALLLLLAGGGGLAWWLAARPPEPNNNGPEPVAVFQPAAAAAADNKPPEPATEFNLAEGRKGVVFIKCINPGVGTGVGSGFLATKDGLVYTNHHVIEPDGPGRRILVGVPSPKNIEELDYFAASVVSTPGPGNAPDFAVLKIAAKPDYGAFQPLPLAGDKDRPPALGDKVAVLGYPFIKRDQPVFSFNKGAVSATKVDLDGKSFYQTDAAVNPGNSGGPLVNAEGKVVGIVTAKKQNANNMGYALYLSETRAAAETAVARAPGVHPEPGPGDFKAVAAAGAIAPKAANYEVVAGKGVEAKNRLEIDGDGGHYWLALKEPLPPNFQVVMQVAVEFLQGRQRVYVSQRQLLRTLCVRFGTDDVRADILEHAGRLIQYTHSRLMYWNANEAMSAGNDGSPDEPFILTITRVADQTVMSVNGRVVLNVRDGRALTGKHRLCVGGFLSRLHLGEVAVTDLGDGKGVKLPPAPPPRAVSPDPGPAIGRGPGPGPAPKPGDTRKAEDVAVKDIAYPADGLPVSACWSADGKAVFVVDARGGVRRFAADTLKEEAKADLALKPSWLSLSAAGLLVTAPDTQKLHVLDPQTLKTTATIDVPRMTRVVSAPGLSVAVGAGQLVPLLVIDLKAGKALKEYSGKDFGKLEVAAFDSVAMTPDGKYAFASTQDGMHRFRVAGGTIEYEDSTYPGVRGSGAFASVFCDEGYACVPSGGGNMSPPKDHPAQGNYQCFVYPVADLKKPAFTLKGAAHWAVAFDHKRGVAYSTTGGAEVSLVAFNTSGLLVKQYRLGVGSVKQVVRQPQGDKLVLLTDKAAAVVDLSKTAGKPSDPGGPEPAKLAGGAARKVDDVTVAELAGPPGSLPAYGCWSADGKTIYLMDGRGTVRRVAADGLKEEATAALALNAAWLALSAEGIVVTAPDTQMLYLLDAQTLKTKAKIEAPGVTRVVSAPGLGVAVGVGGNRPLSLFDLKAGKATGEYGGKDAAGRECRSFDAIAMPPGGKYLFASNGPALLRFLVEDGKLVYEETSYDIRNTGAGFDGIACDDGYAALPCGGGNNAVDKDHPAPKVYQTYVYPVTNLRKPILGLAGAYRIAFDHAHETIYGTTGGAEVNLVKYSAGGATLKEYKLGVGTVQQVIVQLQGEKVLLLTDKTTAVVGLPKK